MNTINDLEELSLPLSYRRFITTFLENVAKLPFVQKVVLFGSCATGRTNENSDIDLFVITDREITEDEEFKISFECTPDYSIHTYIPVDMIVKPISIYDRFKFVPGMVEKYVELEGIDLSEPLSKCRRNI